MRSLSIFARAFWFESRAKWHQRQIERHERWMRDIGSPAARRLERELAASRG